MAVRVKDAIVDGMVERVRRGRGPSPAEDIPYNGKGETRLVRHRGVLTPACVWGCPLLGCLLCTYKTSVACIKATLKHTKGLRISSRAMKAGKHAPAGDLAAGLKAAGTHANVLAHGQLTGPHGMASGRAADAAGPQRTGGGKAMQARARAGSQQQGRTRSRDAGAAGRGPSEEDMEETGRYQSGARVSYTGRTLWSALRTHALTRQLSQAMDSCVPRHHAPSYLPVTRSLRCSVLASAPSSAPRRP